MTETKVPNPLEARPWGREDYLKWFEAFLGESRMSATRFGWDALGDPGFMAQLRSAQNVTIDRLERGVAFVRKHMAEMEAQSL
jgi:hypothetical protein